MYWIALSPKPETPSDRAAWTWWALRFTPRVAWVEEEALLLEVSGSLRLFGGRKDLPKLLLSAQDELGAVQWAAGATSPVALALLRTKCRSIPVPRRVDAFALGIPDAPARLNGGNTCRWRAEVRLGDALERNSTVVDAEVKNGRTGRLELYTIETVYRRTDSRTEVANLRYTAIRRFPETAKK